MSTAVVTDPQLESEALTIVQQSAAIVVSNNETRELASELGRAIAGTYKRIEEWFSPMKRAAAQAHKEICNRENEALGPLAQAKLYLGQQIGRYDQEQEQLRREAERAAQEQARIAAEEAAKKLAEETAIQDAIALEAAGDTKGAEAVLSNPAPQPVYVPPVVIPRTVPKTQGVATVQNWKFRITNADLIPREYLEVDEKKIGQVVRAMKDKCQIPGIEVYPDSSARFRA